MVVQAVLFPVGKLNVLEICSKSAPPSMRETDSNYDEILRIQPQTLSKPTFSTDGGALNRSNSHIKAHRSCAVL